MFHTKETEIFSKPKDLASLESSDLMSPQQANSPHSLRKSILTKLASAAPLATFYDITHQYPSMLATSSEYLVFGLTGCFTGMLISETIITIHALAKGNLKSQTRTQLLALTSGGTIGTILGVLAASNL